MADTIKGLSEVDKSHEQRLMLFDALEADIGRTPYQLYCVKDKNHKKDLMTTASTRAIYASSSADRITERIAGVSAVTGCVQRAL